jgi:hypothetical protein
MLAKGESLFAYLSHQKEEAAIFDQAMTEMSGAVAQAAANAYDFSQIRRVVDIGGGQGRFLGTVLAAHPHLKGILFDRPEVVRGADRVLGDLGVSSRCSIVGGNFLEAVPAEGDAYLVKNVFHNWSDEAVRQIVRHIHRASQPEGKLLICEYCLEEQNPNIALRVDLAMMAVTEGGRLRTGAEYRELLLNCGYELRRKIPVTEDGVVLWEAVRRMDV